MKIEELVHTAHCKRVRPTRADTTVYLDGGDGNDILYGNDGDVDIFGGQGKDFAFGGDGKAANNNEWSVAA
jgi:Ca2+-binding RTX toxin-like protein